MTLNFEQKLVLGGSVLSFGLLIVVGLKVYSHPHRDTSSLTNQIVCTPSGEAFIIRRAIEENYYESIKAVLARTPSADAQCAGVALYRVK